MAGLTMDPIAHLYRRAGFSATPAELAAGRQQGYAATLDQILNFDSAPDAAEANCRRAFNGRCMVIVRAGERPGVIRLTATSPGLKPAVLSLRAGGT
jgi:glycosyl hydrolase family 2